MNYFLDDTWVLAYLFIAHCIRSRSWLEPLGGQSRAMAWLSHPSVNYIKEHSTASLMRRLRASPRQGIPNMKLLVQWQSTYVGNLWRKSSEAVKAHETPSTCWTSQGGQGCYTLGQPFQVGQRVRRRDKPWGIGFVTCLAPLKVTLYMHPADE